MATFKAVVQRHQQRRDGKYPVSIRITHNRKSCYVSTGLYCSLNQLTKKSFEIKDQFILARVVKTMKEWEQMLISLDMVTLHEMSVDELKKYLSTSAKNIDYFGYCHKLIGSDRQKWQNLNHALALVEEMGVKKMMATDFTSSFIRRFKEHMDNKVLSVRGKDGTTVYKHYSLITKRSYLSSLCQVFRMLQQEYNTEFTTIITHNPFIGFETYRAGLTVKRSISLERIKAFFGLVGRTDKQQIALDLMKLSFCLCGINFMDLFSMEKSAFDSKNMRITYERHKTRNRRIDHALTSVHVEPEILPLIHKYAAPADDKMLFRFADYTADCASTRKLYQTLDYTVRSLHFEHVSPYSFRHSWATIARNECDISKDDIDLCLVHSGNNPMADVYIRPDWSRIDKANRKVLDVVFGSVK